uniref:Uncharacterized protein n=1 Tax=Acrobeloides nanus TaxID=290746 RepID=A0A914E1F5_9BILA
MMHLPTFISTSRYVDFRINTTDISTLTAIAALNTDNVLIGKLVIALMAAIKMSNAMFNLIVIFIVLWIACNFYFWPAYRNILVEFVYIIEDSSRMLTPILLFIFSTPLRKAFRQIYWSKITAHNNVLRHSQHISIISRPHPNQVHTY